MPDLTPAMHRQATVTLLEDLKMALEHILPDLVPSMPAHIEVTPGERPRLVIELPPSGAIYPYVLQVKRGEAPVRPSAFLREHPVLLDRVLRGEALPAGAKEAMRR